MAGIRDMNLTKAYQLMHERGVTTDTIAEKLHTSRAYVSRVLGGYERRGATWLRVKSLLTPAEIDLLEAVPEKEPQKTILRIKQTTNEPALT